MSDLMTTAEVAEHYKVSRYTVQRWAREGILESVKLPGTRMNRFRREDVERLSRPSTTEHPAVHPGASPGV